MRHLGEVRLVGVHLGHIREGHELVLPRRDGGELLLGINALGQEGGETESGPGDEAEIGDGNLVADEPVLLGEDLLEDGEDAGDLLGVALDAVCRV